MNDAAHRPLTLADQVPATLTVAAPDVVGALAVFPVITDRRASLDFVSFAEGRAHGVTVKELPGAASVNDLVVHNPLDVAVLVYEGEEVVGAQQNRTFDVSALVPAHSTLQVPVCCVEAGRWDGARHAESFAPAPQAAYPELRRLKNRQVRESLAAGGEARAQQGEVWREVAEKSGRHGVHSQTGAMHDLFESRRTMLDSVQQSVTMKCSQVGMLAAIAGRFVVLDQVNNPDAFAALHGPLVQGYALDALEAAREVDPPSPSLEDAREFLALLLGAATTPTRAVGLGNGLQFEFGGLAGTGRAVEAELVTLTAFAQDGEQPRSAPTAGRVRRPSRRAR